jgi:hypothetical protein
MSGIIKNRSVFIRNPNKIKSFLRFTAVIEAITGISLMLVPGLVIHLLLGLSLNGPAATIVTILAGIAVSSVALVCWLLRDKDSARAIMKMVLFYNSAVLLLLLYGAVVYGLNSPGLWLASGFHFIQAIRGIWLMRVGRKKWNTGPAVK